MGFKLRNGTFSEEDLKQNGNVSVTIKHKNRIYSSERCSGTVLLIANRLIMKRFEKPAS